MTSSPPPENTPPPPPPPSTSQVQAPVVVRKFPAPCWSQDETLSLIHAYQDKWFSLRRRNLRTADWEAVADEVNRRCPNQSPPKTSAQCRHKMEKLRKRYRTEKQRISNLPSHHHHLAGNRLFPPSSWVFFDLMDAMEIGSASGSGSASIPTTTTTTTTLLPNHPPTATTTTYNNNNNNNADLNVHNPSYDYNPNPPKHHFNNNNTNNTRPKEDLGKYFDDILMSVGKGPIKFKLKNNNYADHHHHNTPPPPPPDFDFDYNNSTTTSAARNFVSGTGTRVNFNKRKLGNSASAGFMNLNGCSSKRGGRSTSKRAYADTDGDGDGVVGDMVASINMLGDGLLKMEKMKMEMMQDLQRQRMEMELNNSKMILESQHTILNAFLQGFNKLNNLKLMQLQD